MWIVPGVPVRAPVVVLNVAHDGLLAILNVSVVPGFGSLAAGTNEYAAPTATDVVGTPEITGGVFVTVIENAANEAGSCPSLTLITMPFVVPMWLATGVPCRMPVVVLNVAHGGT